MGNWWFPVAEEKKKLLRKHVAMSQSIRRVLLTEDFSIETIPDPELEAELRRQAELRQREEDHKREIDDAVSAAIGRTTADLEAAFQEKLAREKQEAFENGRENGKEEGRALGAETLTPLRNRLTELLVSMAREKEAIFVDARELLLSLLFQISEKIVRRQIVLERETVLSVVTEALRYLAEATKVTIHLSTDDHTFMQERVFEELQKQRLEADIAVVADERLEDGDCVITTNAGEIDARLSTKLKELEKLLQVPPRHGTSLKES